MRARDELLAAIDREQALIGRLAREREEAQARVRSLQAQLGTPAGEDVACSVPPPPPSTAGEKVALFRGLFRGRDDVFAKLWVNPRTDRKGYAPACANEWVSGVCEKPRVKCSECPNQAFISLSDHVVLDHLQGRHVIGVYPLFEDDTCWFLAADFDEESWADDVAAFVETSRTLGLSAAVERSRSGNDGRRNELILNDVIAALEQGRSPILLTERRDHLEYFAARLRGFTRHLVVLQGGVTAKARREAKAQLAAIPNDEERLILATGRYIGEGFDDARLDTLFLAMPVSWKGTLVQYTGRLHRLSPGKTEVRIYDYVDTAVPLLARMFEKRLRGYRAIGYAREATRRAPADIRAEPTVEHDEDVAADFDGSP